MISFFFFFFNDTATPEIYTLSLHDALPISSVHRFMAGPLLPERQREHLPRLATGTSREGDRRIATPHRSLRSEEHTSELQSRLHLVCRLLLEKKKNKKS